jgi:hypothetical protein
MSLLDKNAKIDFPIGVLTPMNDPLKEFLRSYNSKFSLIEMNTVIEPLEINFITITHTIAY